MEAVMKAFQTLFDQYDSEEDHKYAKEYLIKELSKLTKEERSTIVNRPVQEYTLLYEACNAGVEETVDFLVNFCGADIEKKSLSCQGFVTPLVAAISRQDINILKFLLLHKANVNGRLSDRLESNSPKWMKCSNCYNDHLRHSHSDYYTCFYDMNSKYYQTEHNETPYLTLCCNLNWLKGMQLLIDSGADVNVTDKQNNTPLSIALGHEYLEVAELLLKNGADPFIKNHEDFDALHIACLTSKKTIKCLLNNVNYPPERIADAWELFGARFKLPQGRERKLFFWKKALMIRQEHNVQLQEVTSIEELRKYKDCDLQLLDWKIKSRILGFNNLYILRIFQYFESEYVYHPLKNFRFQLITSIRALTVQLENHCILCADYPYIICEIIRQSVFFYKYCVFCQNTGIKTTDFPTFSEIATLFKLLSSKLVQVSKMLQDSGDSLDDEHKCQRYSFDHILTWMPRLIHILGLAAVNDEDKHEVRKLIVNFTKNNFKSMSKDSLLHHFFVATTENYMSYSFQEEMFYDEDILDDYYYTYQDYYSSSDSYEYYDDNDDDAHDYSNEVYFDPQIFNDKSTLKPSKVSMNFSEFHGDFEKNVFDEDPLTMKNIDKKHYIASFESAVKLVIESGLPVNATNIYGYTPLHLAVKNNFHKNVCKLLTDRCAYVFKVHEYTLDQLKSTIHKNDIFKFNDATLQYFAIKAIHKHNIDYTKLPNSIKLLIHSNYAIEIRKDGIDFINNG